MRWVNDSAGFFSTGKDHYWRAGNIPADDESARFPDNLRLCVFKMPLLVQERATRRILVMRTDGCNNNGRRARAGAHRHRLGLKTLAWLFVCTASALLGFGAGHHYKHAAFSEGWKSLHAAAAAHSKINENQRRFAEAKLRNATQYRELAKRRAKSLP